MEFIKSWKFAAIIIGIFSVVCLGLVIYGVTTHTEPGLMQQTPGFAGQDTPIPVTVRAYHPDGPVGPDADVTDTPMASAEDERHALTMATAAVSVINLRLGFQVLEIVPLGSPHPHRPLIDIEVGVPTEQTPADGVVVDPGGAAMFHAGQRECYVQTANTGTDSILDLVIQHELGHCLGLAHDPFESSIMRPTQTDPGTSFPPRITDSDRTLLRHVFGQP